jgi:hypothetical protein
MRAIIKDIESLKLDYSKNLIENVMQYVSESKNDVKEVLQSIFVLNPNKRLLAS